LINVYAEHETYSTDIEELNFHLTQRRKTEAVAGAKVKEMERADAQIRQEIDDIKKYTCIFIYPLIFYLK